MKPTDEQVERVARAIAKENGDDFDKIPADKPEWIAERGHFDGRFRDINEPRKSDYLEMARAAIEAMPALPAQGEPVRGQLVNALSAIEQRANESGTGEMGLLDTVHAMARIARVALALVKP